MLVVSSSSASQPRCESPFMLKAVSVASISSSTQRHKDSARAISTSPMARAGAWSVIGPSSLLSRGRQRTGLGDDAVWTGDSHSGGVKRATVRAVNRQTCAQRHEEGACHTLIEGGGGVKVTVKYSLRNRVQRWSPGVGQPLEVSMEAIHQQRTGQYSTPTDRKIYLSRVTAYLGVSDATGHLDSPDPLLDKADVNTRLLRDVSQAPTLRCSFCRRCRTRLRS